MKKHIGIFLLGWCTLSSAAIGEGVPLLLEWGGVNTSSAEQQRMSRALRSSSRAPSVQRQSSRGTVPWLVQFNGVIREEWKTSMEKAGAVLQGYVPENAFLVEATPGAIAKIGAMPAVSWVGEYLPEYKRSKPVRSLLAKGTEVIREYNVLLFHPEDLPGIGMEIAELPGAFVTHMGPVADRALIRVRLPSSAVEEVTGWSEVEWIEPYLKPQIWNDVAVRTNKMNVSNVWTTLGLTGEGQTIAVCDTGLDTGNTNTLHRDFTNRVTGFPWANGAYSPGGNWGDAHGHGTHVAGSVLGNGTMSTGLYKGVAYEADLIIQGVGADLGGIPADLNTLFQQAFDNGARIHSDSWGWDDFGRYNLDSRSLDMFVWSNKTMLVLVAACNSGIDADGDGVIDLGSVGSPGTAKNCLTVGAAESHRTTGGYSGMIWGTGSWAAKYPADPIKSDYVSQPDSPQGMAAFSSRGPCLDGRIKPDLVAPGTDIISARSRNSSSTGWGTVSGNTNYLYRGGTSMATPLMAGAAGLAREWLMTTGGIADPSAAMVKALMINGARNMAPGQYGTGATQEIPDVRPNNVQGWGHVDLFTTLQPGPDQFLHLYDTGSLSTDQTNTFTLTVGVATTNPFVLTMAYSDYWAAIGAGKKLVNDLDLTVQKPSGSFLYANGRTNVDATNNVEMVEFSPDEVGTYTVRVVGRTVPSGGSQDYALVIRGYEDPVPSAPEFNALGAQSATPGQAMSFTVGASGTPTPALALLSTTASSGYSFTPEAGQLSYAPPLADVGSQDFIFTASNSLGVATQVVGVTVGKANQAIVFAPIGDQLTTNVVTLSAMASSGLAVGFAVSSGPASISGGVHLTFTGAGAVSIVASQPGDDSWNPAPDVTNTFTASAPPPRPDLSTTNVNVRENGEGRFFVKLDRAPASNMTVAVARSAGDTNLTVKSGGTLTFTPANWSAWQVVTLGAADDADAANGTATFQVTAPGAPAVQATAAELDDDIGENLALASGGATISGGSGAARLIDGVHTSSANYGSTTWTNMPPGMMTLDLKVPTVVARMRLLNYDWSCRVHQYRIESSLNGTVWSTLVDASAGEHRGWEEWDVSATARYLRFTGLSNSANQYVCIAEWEVYGAARPVLSGTAVNVRENGEGRFFVKLNQAPTSSVPVAVTRTAGDTNLTVKSGGTLTFTLANWNAWQMVTLAAADDADAANGTATFQMVAPGAAAVQVTATALDDDIGENLALASGGATISGGSGAARLIDGVHTSSANYGSTTWTNVPPGTMTLDLKTAMPVSRIQLLNYDWSYRVHQYRIESSVDGAAWSTLVDASAGEHRGWEDWAVSATARYLRFTGLSNSANQYVCIAEWEVYGGIRTVPVPVLSTTNVNVRENGEGRFFVKLSQAPASNLTVAVSRTAGAANLTVKSGGTLTFTPANWNTWQMVTLEAADDADAANGTATFQVAAMGAEAVQMTATELDDDIGENFALASGGATITGGGSPARLIDGVHTSSANYGNTVWTNVPPGTMTLDLKTATAVSRIRLLNWDWTYRVHQYRIESSMDGTNWSTLVDASAGEHRGWEDWTVAGPSTRYLRFTGLSNSVNAFVCIAEWEVYGERSARKMSLGPSPGLPLAHPETECMDIESFPMTVVTSEDGPEHTNGWAAVDGDTNSLWTGRSGAGGWHIAVGYDSPLRLTNLVVDLAEGSLTDFQVLYSLDAEDWQPLPEDLDRNPVELNYLWLLFPGDALVSSGPRVIEIRPQQ